MKLAVLALLTLAASHGTAGATEKPTHENLTAAKMCMGHVKGVYFYRQKTRSYERKLGRHPSRSVFNASRVKSCRYTVWVAHHWQRKLSAARKDYIELLAARRAAQIAESRRTTTSNFNSGGSAICGESCVECESGGNPQAVSPDGIYWGLYQFDYSTWKAHGGNPATYGSAGASEQAAIASRVRYDAWPNC